MKKAVIFSVVLALLFLSYAYAQDNTSKQAQTTLQFSSSLPKDHQDPIPSEKYSGPMMKNLKPPKATYLAPQGAQGVSTGLYTHYDYQTNGGPVQYLESNPLEPWNVHVIMMSSLDSANVSASRRTTYTMSTDYGNTWDDFMSVPAIRSGFPSMTLYPDHPILPGRPPVIANHTNPLDDALDDIRSIMYMDQGEGSFAFAEFRPPFFNLAEADEPIWPQVAVTTNGNIVMSAIRPDNDGIYAITMDVNGVFQSWQSIDTTFAAAASSLSRGPGGKVALVWRTTGDTAEIAYRISTNNGVSFGPKQVADKETATYFPYWQGLDAMYIGEHLYITYPAASIVNNALPYASFRIRLWNSNTNTAVTVIDSTNFPFIMRASATQSGYHSGSLTYPEIGTNPTGTRIYIACDAFLVDQYDAAGHNYGDILYTYSDNGGVTWADVKNLTRTPTLDERYVAMSTINPKINDSNYVFIAYQEDYVPGSSVQDNRPATRAWQKFKKINTDFRPLKDIGIITVRSVNWSGIHAIGVPETVKVIIEHNGTETPAPANFTLTYNTTRSPININDGTREDFTGVSWVGKYTTVKFTQTWLPSAPGPVKVYVRAFYTGDLDGTNDEGNRQIIIAPPIDLSMSHILQTNLVLPKTQGPNAPVWPNIEMKFYARNLGSFISPAGGFLVKWTVDGTPQTAASRPQLAYAGIDSFPMTYTPAERGTYMVKAWTEVAGDTVEENDTLSTRVFAYPGSAFSIAYDDKNDDSDSYWGVDTRDSALTAAVRFTATQDMALMNVDAEFDNKMTDATYPYVKVRVWAAGTDSTPGPKLYEKVYTTSPYVVTEGPSAWVSFPIANGLVFANGEDFWVGLSFARNDSGKLYFPMGIDEKSPTLPYNTTPRRQITSWFSEDDGITWWPIRDVLIPKPGGNITHDFVIRAIGVSATPGGKFNVANSWNMISIPVQTTDTKDYLFPTSTSSAFVFTPTGYQPRTTLNPGPGYWLKFGAAQRVDLVGPAITNLSIPVVAGWNLIGSISSTVPTSAVTVPGGAASLYYGYNAGYVTATSISPGKGYWIKAGSAGNLIISSTAKAVAETKQPDISNFNKITITDKIGNKQTLYFGENIDGKFPVNFFEMPPTAPEGIFDVRFASQRLLEAYPIEGTGEYGININSASFPITVSYELVSRTKNFTIQNGDKSYTLNSEKGNFVVENLKTGYIALKIEGMDNLPTDFNLGQNYPNPFNPSTKFEFAMPKNARVEIVVYDILGSKVATLFDGVKSAGYHSIEWNGTNAQGHIVPSGVYFVKMTSDGFSAVRKALMLK